MLYTLSRAHARILACIIRKLLHIHIRVFALALRAIHAVNDVSLFPVVGSSITCTPLHLPLRAAFFLFFLHRPQMKMFGQISGRAYTIEVSDRDIFCER